MKKPSSESGGKPRPYYIRFRVKPLLSILLQPFECTPCK
jgi:hypothetical protein